MKTEQVRVCGLSIAVGGLVLVSGCQITLTPGNTWYQPPPPVQETVMVPETYVEVDGVNVGIIGGQYYILSGGVWVIDRAHYAYYHGWFRDHPTYWREHAIRNELYRRDAHGHERPIGGGRPGGPGHGDPRVQPGHGEQHPNVGPGQPKQQPPQQKGQPQQKPQTKKTTDKDQKPQ